MPELCAYPPCKCLAPDHEIFCGETCAMLGAGLVNQVRVTTTAPLKSEDEIAPRCACGHPGCGDGPVSAEIH